MSESEFQPQGHYDPCYPQPFLLDPGTQIPWAKTNPIKREKMCSWLDNVGFIGARASRPCLAVSRATCPAPAGFQLRQGFLLRNSAFFARNKARRTRMVQRRVPRLRDSSSGKAFF
jgi:hypothetical protein